MSLQKLNQWESHPSRRLYAFEDVEAARLRSHLRAYTDASVLNDETFYIETCAYGQQAAVADPQWCDCGVEMLRVGLKALRSDGAYVGEDAHHSVSFFLESLARAALLVERTTLRLADDEAALLKCCGEWFADPAVWFDRWWRDTMHHRFFLNASALVLLDRVVGLAPWCRERAVAWIAEGMRRQRDDGAHTEWGGHDTGYHSLAMTFAAGMLLVGELPGAVNDALRDSLARGANWLASRIGENGAIDASGNTRMNGGGEVDRFGQTKAIKPYESAFALVGAGIALDDALFIDLAARITLEGAA